MAASNLVVLGVPPALANRIIYEINNQTGPSAITGSLAVSGNATIGGTLSVTGNSNFGGAVTTIANNQLDITGATNSSITFSGSQDGYIRSSTVSAGKIYIQTRGSSGKVAFLDSSSNELGRWDGSTKDLFLDATGGGNLIIARAGKGIQVKEGSNARMGNSTLVGGTVVVANTSITASTRIFLSRAATGGTAGHLSYTKVNATSFTITSSSGTDTSTIDWLLVEAAA